MPIKQQKMKLETIIMDVPGGQKILSFALNLVLSSSSAGQLEYYKAVQVHVD